jgi:hypothetical protein
MNLAERLVGKYSFEIFDEDTGVVLYNVAPSDIRSDIWDTPAIVLYAGADQCNPILVFKEAPLPEEFRLACQSAWRLVQSVNQMEVNPF